jgi:hypothetical protein
LRAGIAQGHEQLGRDRPEDEISPHSRQIAKEAKRYHQQSERYPQLGSNGVCDHGRVDGSWQPFPLAELDNGLNRSQTPGISPAERGVAHSSNLTASLNSLICRSQPWLNRAMANICFPTVMVRFRFASVIIPEMPRHETISQVVKAWPIQRETIR